MRCRVVCGLGVTMLTFCPTSALSKVDLPTFGRPTSAAKPLRKLSEDEADLEVTSVVYRNQEPPQRSLPALLAGVRDFREDALGGFLLGAAAARAAARVLAVQVRDLAGHMERLRVGLAFDPVDRVTRQ